jgi:hypothetical protein
MVRAYHAEKPRPGEDQQLDVEGFAEMIGRSGSVARQHGVLGQFAPARGASSTIGAVAGRSTE